MAIESDELVWALNLVNGQVARIQRHVLEHPTFSANQVEVAPFSESYDPNKWKPVSKDDWIASHQSTELSADISAEDSTDPEHPGEIKNPDAGETPNDPFVAKRKNNA